VWYFGTVPTVWYFGTVPTVWYFGTVPTVCYFVFHFIISKYFSIFDKLNFLIKDRSGLVPMLT
jgi:hypothetical protein